MSEGIVRDGERRPEQQTGQALDQDPEAREFLGFTLGGEPYAFPLARVHEIVKPLPITGVPRSPHYVIGVMSVRGRITTVVDLRRRLQLPETPVDKHSRILLVDSGQEVLGAIVDRVLQVYRLGSDEMELANVMGAETAEHVMGVGRPQAGRGVGRAREGLPKDQDILILVDPVALLGR